MSTLNIVLQSSAAGVSFAAGVVAALLAASVYTSKQRLRDLAEMRETNARILNRADRSAAASENASNALYRIANQLEKNGK